MDIEHIRAIASGIPTNVPDRKRWLGNFISYNLGSPYNAEAAPKWKRVKDKGSRKFCEKADELIKTDPFDAEAFESLFEEIINRFDPPSDDEFDHGIGNLAMLDQITNRSYKNAIFPIKRKQILDLEKQGGFIPICTRNVFLKYYSNDVTNMLFWTDEDANDYTSEMATMLITYFIEDD